MNELQQLIELLKAAIEAGQTIELTASDITIEPGPTGQPTVTINGPTITTTA